MARALEYLAQALEEAEAAARWYAERSESAAGGFTDELDAAAAAIVERPEAWPIFDHGTRRFLLRRYPFSVVYRIEQHRILIVEARFSGTWAIDLEASAAANGGGGAGPPAPFVDAGGAKPICGSEITIVQTRELFTVVRKLGERSLSATFKLDGTQTKHPVLACRALSNAMEREAALVGSTAGETKQTLVIRADQTLLVETTYGGTPGSPRPIKTIYKRH